MKQCTREKNIFVYHIPFAKNRGVGGIELAITDKPIPGEKLLEIQRFLVGYFSESIFQEIRKYEFHLQGKQMKYWKTEARHSFMGILGKSKAMNEIFEKIEIASKELIPVLITGESGTGKELVANAIHNLSGQRGALIIVNCGAIPIDFLEEELFGAEYESGLRGIPKRGKPGKIELANEGTLFLDEIGTMRLDHQHKILRVIEDKEVWRIGATHSIPVDFRIIAATNENIEQKKEFRKDLYYRLAVMKIHIPPLRERKEDIPLLINHFLQRYGRMEIGIDKDVHECFLKHEWPGNVRELMQVLYSAVVVAKQKGRLITPEVLEFSGHNKVLQSCKEENKQKEFHKIPSKKRRQKVLLYLKEHGKITRQKCVEILGISNREANRILEKLQTNGAIEMKGRGPSTHYTKIN